MRRCATHHDVIVPDPLATSVEQLAIEACGPWCERCGEPVFED